MHVRKLRRLLARQEAADALAQSDRVLPRLHDLHQRDALAERRRGPSGLRRDVGERQAGFLGQFADHAALEVDRVADDVGRIRRAGREIDLAGGRGVRAHLAQQKRAVRRAQRRHREAVAHRGVGKAPVAPGDEAREVGFEIRAGQHAVGDVTAPHHQHAAVPHLRLVCAQPDEMRVDLGAPRDRERPVARLVTQVEPRQRNDRDVVHARGSSQARNARSSLDGAFHHDDRAARDGRAGQLAAGQLERELHQTWASHLIALLDAHEVLAVLVFSARRQIARERRRRRSGGGILADARAGREHARVEIVAGFARLTANDEGRGKAATEGRFETREVRTAAPDRLDRGDRHDREGVSRRPALRNESVEPDVGRGQSERRGDRGGIRAAFGLRRQPRNVERRAAAVRRRTM